MLGQVGHGSNDIKKFHRNFFWLKFKIRYAISLAKIDSNTSVNQCNVNSTQKTLAPL